MRIQAPADLSPHIFFHCGRHKDLQSIVHFAHLRINAVDTSINRPGTKTDFGDIKSGFS
jgi:hypothetical protein